MRRLASSMRARDDFPDHSDIWSNEELDEEFPLGDGTAEIGATVLCPYCGETIDIALDPGSGDHQSYVEDCAVCCQPWQVTVRYRGGAAQVEVRALDDA